MFMILTASADTYITNKIIASKLRATDANVGRAGTLDLFKLYSESSISGTEDPIEISRLLVKFDIEPLRSLTGTSLDLNSSSFRATLQLFDLLGGQTNPDNFNIIAFPLSQSFDEGRGRDVAQFGDLDRANFITASYSNGANNVWFVSGAAAQGLLGSNDIDIISSGNLQDGDGVKNLWKSQYFDTGREDLSLDVTTVVSATLAGQIPDHGFLISFSGSEETDNKSRFVKRFASRHSSNRALHPRILVSFDDTIFDNSHDFYFDSTGSIFLNSYLRNRLTNLVSGSALTPITGQNSLIMKLQTGSFVKYVTASQFARGGNNITGVYSATFAISSDDETVYSGTQTLEQLIAASGYVNFDQWWESLDGTVGYHTGSLTIKRLDRTSFQSIPKELDFICTNSRPTFQRGESHRFRVFIRDLDAERFAVKIPLRLRSVIADQVYYRIVDRQTGKVVVPFLTANNGTRMSSDSDGLFFDLNMSGLPVGRQYGIQLRSDDFGVTEIYDLHNVSFRVE